MKKRIPASVQYAEEIMQEIENGGCGAPGKQFYSTRGLAQKYGCSLVTAQKVMVLLREAGCITLAGKKYYLTHGRVGNRTPYAKARGERKKLIGFHVTNIESPFFAALVKEAEQAAGKHGYRLITASSRYQEKEEAEILRMFRDIGVAGILSCPGLTEETTKLYKKCILPFVFLCRRPRSMHADSVLVDNYSAGKNVARHLCKMGYRSFAYIGLKKLEQGEDTRFIGFREALLAEGFVLPEENVLRIDSAESGAVAWEISRFIRNLQAPVAIFCFQDLLAVEVFKSCRTLKREVPEEVAICGFDNLSVSEVTTKPLTTVGYPIRTMAETAVSLLIRRIEGSEEEIAECAVAPSLFVRESTRKDAEKPAGSLLDKDVLYKI